MQNTVYVIEFIYEDGRRKLFLDEQYMRMRSRESVETFARQKMKKFNHEAVSRIVGRIKGFEVYACKA